MFGTRILQRWRVLPVWPWPKDMQDWNTEMSWKTRRKWDTSSCRSCCQQAEIRYLKAMRKKDIGIIHNWIFGLGLDKMMLSQEDDPNSGTTYGGTQYVFRICTSDDSTCCSSPQKHVYSPDGPQITELDNDFLECNECFKVPWEKCAVL